MKIGAVRKTSEPPAWPSLKTMRIIRALRRKWSLKAAKNWHQKSGAKRFDAISLPNIEPSCETFLQPARRSPFRSERDSPSDHLPVHPPVTHQAVKRLTERRRLVVLEEKVA